MNWSMRNQQFAISISARIRPQYQRSVIHGLGNQGNAAPGNWGNGAIRQSIRGAAELNDEKSFDSALP
jgi:hypothetical protein